MSTKRVINRCELVDTYVSPIRKINSRTLKHSYVLAFVSNIR